MSNQQSNPSSHSHSTHPATSAHRKPRRALCGVFEQLEMRELMSASVTLAVPTSLGAADIGPHSVQLGWVDKDTADAGYKVLRSSDGQNFAQIAQITGNKTTKYTDNTVNSDQTYSYEIQAFQKDVVSGASATASVTTALVAPVNLAITGQTTGSVALSWTGADPSAAGYAVVRATDGVHFTQIATLDANAAAYEDDTVASGKSYVYAVVAFDGSNSSPLSAKVVAHTPLSAPTGLSAVAQGSNSVALSWTNTDANSAGVTIFRADGSRFTAIGTVKTASGTTYVDTTAGSFHTYQYEIQATNGASVSPMTGAVSATTAMAAPVGLTATAKTPISTFLSWTAKEPAATGYVISRSTDGTNFTTLAQVSGVKTTSYTDSTVSSDAKYYYRVVAVTQSSTSAASNIASTTTPLIAPGGLAVAGQTSGSVDLTWTDNDSNAAGYNVLRATDGTHFTRVAQLGANAATYEDDAVVAAHSYAYEVQAYDGSNTSAISNKATGTTPLTTPTNLTATVTQANSVALTWTDGDSATGGFKVLRATDGQHFNVISTKVAGNARSFTDTTAVAGQAYQYQVQSVAGALTSAASNTANATLPGGGTSGGVTIATRFGDELIITAAGSNDSVDVSQSGNTLSIVADGQTSTDPVPAAGVFVYTRFGNDTVDIESTVAARTTVDTIDGAATSIVSNGSNVSAWIDNTDTFSGSATVHRVNTFAGGVSKALGAALANPKDSGTTTTANRSLFGTGPVAGDVNQGEVGDCYFLSSLAAFAGTSPATLQESAVDLGDGTCAVQFMSNHTPTFVRVSEQFPSGPFNGFKFANPGANNSIWAMVMEKAFAYFRTGANTYNSINSGWMSEVYGDLGVNSNSFAPSSYTDDSFYSLVSNALNNGQALTFGTGNAPDLVSGHAYTLVSASKDNNGVAHYVVRNPWGVAGDAIENSSGYATLTFAQMKANFDGGCVAMAA